MKRVLVWIALSLFLAITASAAEPTKAAATTDSEVMALVKSETQAAPANTTNVATAPVPQNDEQLPVFKAPEVKADKAEKKSAAAMWLRMVGSLVIVLAMFGGGIYAFKKFPATNRIAKQARMIQVLGQHHFGAKKSLAVIRVAGETVLIGVTDNNISLLKPLALLDDDLPGEAISQKSKFTAALKQKVTSEINDASVEEGEEFSMEGIRDIVSRRIKDLKESRS